MNNEAIDLARKPPKFPGLAPEHADFLTTLAVHRGLLRCTVSGLTAEQAASTPSASELNLAGLIKHVATTERAWTAFMVGGAAALQASYTADNAWVDGFRLVGDETLQSVLDDYEQVAEHTHALVASLDDLSASHPLPEAPWFEQGGVWSARRVLMHIIAETSQHAGHADVIRESIDGAKTMG